MLINILESVKPVIGDKEYNYRRDKLKKTYDRMMNEDKIIESYYSIAHEIRAIDMFLNLGDTIISKDSNSEPGVDLVYMNNLIECVTSTTGEGRNLEMIKKSGFRVYNKIIDYNEKFHQVSLRVLSSLVSKRDKYLKDVQKDVVSSEHPFCIFISLGSLTQEWFPGEYCSEATRFLVGRGQSMIKIDKITGKQIGDMSFAYKPFDENNNSSVVITNFFGDSSNVGISAVIITNAELNECYSPQNTVIFTNPFAINKLKVSDFFKYPYWKINKSNEYIPRVCGRKVKISMF